MGLGLGILSYPWKSYIKESWMDLRKDRLTYPYHVCKLKKAIYELKQELSGDLWLKYKFTLNLSIKNLSFQEIIKTKQEREEKEKWKWNKRFDMIKFKKEESKLDSSMPINLYGKIHGDDFETHMSSRTGNGWNQIPTPMKQSFILREIQQELEKHDTSLSLFGLPLPDSDLYTELNNRLIREQISTNTPGLSL